MVWSERLEWVIAISRSRCHRSPKSLRRAGVTVRDSVTAEHANDSSVSTFIDPVPNIRPNYAFRSCWHDYSVVPRDWRRESLMTSPVVISFFSAMENCVSPFILSIFTGIYIPR